jgi:integrase
MPKFAKPWCRKGRGWYVTLDGKQIALGPQRKAAFELYHDLMRQPRERRAVPSDAVSALADLFLEWAQKNRAPDTYEWYRFRLGLFVKRYPDLRIAELKPFHVQQWIDSFDGLSSGSKRNHARSIQRCLSWCEEQGLIDKNPIRRFRKPQGGTRTAVISPEEYAGILVAIRNRSLRDLVIFAWETGARAAECLAIERRHVELDNHRIVFPIDEEKMGRIPRIIYLTKTAEAIICRLVLQAPEGPLFRNTKGMPWTTQSVNCAFTNLQGRMGRVELRAHGHRHSEEAIEAKIKTLRLCRRLNGTFVTKTHAELREEAQRKLWNEAAKDAAKKYCLTLFRHSFCHRLLKSKVDALTVSTLLGHADATMVTSVYSHMNHAPDYLLETLLSTA